LLIYCSGTARKLEAAGFFETSVTDY